VDLKKNQEMGKKKVPSNVIRVNIINRGKEIRMKAIKKKDKTTGQVLAGFSRLAVIVLAVFALVILPYRMDFHKGWLKSTVLLADDGGGDGGGEGGGDGDGDGDGGGDGDGDGGDDGGDDGDSGDDGDDGDDGDSGDDGDDGDHGDNGEHGDDSSGDDHGSSDDSGSSSDRGSSDHSGTDLSDVSGMQGLSPVSSEDEASLVGNWGEPSPK